jgi:peptidyl-dipeptidase A
MNPSFFEWKDTTVKKYKLAEEFYTSLGLDRMTDTFWEKSMLIRPEDRDVQCHASSSDFYTATGTSPKPIVKP